MAFDARGWRKFMVGKTLYFWRLSEGVDAREVFVVRPEVKPHRLLRVVECWCGSAGGVTAEGGRRVRAAIHAAALHGWPAERPRLRLHIVSDTFYLAADPLWLTPTVVALATGIEAELAFDRMPILADALEEAGCDNADILAHCRGPGPHARGCWVVDLLLGKG